jgi:hypothetical protein
MKTGVEIAIQDNASAQARQIATGLNEVAQSADGINSALDPRILEDYNKQLTLIGEKYAQLKNTEKSYEQQQMMRARQSQGMITGMASAAGTGISQLGAGNIGGAAMTAGGGLSSIASLLGGPATLLAGIGLAGGAATNALANQYEQRSGPAQRIAAMAGRFATDVESNTASLREVMASTVESVAKYGKTYEEGMRAQEAYLQAGGRNFAGSRAGAYSMAYGADFGRLAAFEGLGARYGETGGLGVANFVRRQQGLSPAMLEEFVGGIQDIFTSGLSQGIIRSQADIGRGLEFFGRAGATFQGGLGAQKMQGLNQAVAGAAGLQGQSDLFLYRAAAGITGGDMIETKKLMEKGMTPELFKGLMSEFDRFGYGKNESILQLSKMLGVSVTEAEQMYNLKGETPLSTISGDLPAGLGATTETGYIRDVETIKQAIAGGLGAGAFDLRAGLVGGGADIMSLFSQMGDSKIAEEIHTKNITAGTIQVTEAFSTDAFGAEVYAPAKSLAGVRGGYAELIQMIDEARMAGVSETSLYGGIRGAYRDVTSRRGEGGAEITASELETMSDLLRELINAVREPIIVEDASYGQPTAGFTE